MAKLISFVFVTLDGYYKGPGEDISWHRHGREENEYAAEGLRSEGTLLFGRVTYEMMARYWPTPDAARDNPVVAAGMNRAAKVVFSRSLKKVEWPNTRLLKGAPAEEVPKLKAAAGKDMTLLGSGSVLTQLAEAGLIDEYQVMVDPVAIGDGTPLFKGLKRKLDLELVASRAFPSGTVLLTYRPPRT